MRRSPLLASEINLNQEFDESDFDDREREVLKLLAREQNTYFSFQGLKRRLGLHQETLTRTLKRLEEAHAIERSPDGYRLRNLDNTYSFDIQSNDIYAKPLIEAYLPGDVDVTVLFQKLRGHWFSNFRWLSYSQEGTQLSMTWISEDGQMQVQARIGGGKITIVADSLSRSEEPRRIAAAYQLFDHVTKVAEEIMQQPGQPPIEN
jgi:DNA-binding transcriptional ArsR family regulator